MTSCRRAGKEKRVIESSNLVDEYFDLVLVHGDKDLIRIEETLQGAEGFLDKIRYTGLVTPEPVEEKADPQHASDVLVSVGGGAFGQKLTRAALVAKQYSKTVSTKLAAGGRHRIIRRRL